MRSSGAGAGDAGSRDRRRISAPFVVPPARQAPERHLFNCNDSGHGGWGACATHDGSGRSAPWRMATRGSFRSSCRSRCSPSASKSSRCAKISAGAGKFRGGMGFRKRYRILAPCTLWATSTAAVSALGRTGRQSSARRLGHGRKAVRAQRTALQDQSLSGLGGRHRDHAGRGRWRIRTTGATSARSCPPGRAQGLCVGAAAATDYGMK